jgi:hypothetical protein
MKITEALDGALHSVARPVIELLRTTPIALVLFAVVLGYLAWKPRSDLDYICQNMFVAFADLGNPSSGPYQLGFDASVELYERLPSVRNAVRRCDSLRERDTAQQLEIESKLTQRAQGAAAGSVR